MKLIYALTCTGGTDAKVRLLKDATALERQTFRYAYDNSYMYGAKFKQVREPLGDPSFEMFELLDRLRTRQLTGNAAVGAVESFAAKHGNLIKLVCNKDLDCGVRASTINKAWPGLIPQFKVQLAKEAPLEKLSYPLLAQTKYDGVRLVITKTEDQVLFRTRNGKIIHLPEMASRLSTLPNNTMLDTEVTIKKGLTTDRTKVSGMINSARNGNSINEDILAFHVFDWLPLNEFDNAECSNIYQQRLYIAKDIVSNLGVQDTFQIAKTWIVNNIEEVNEIYAQLISEGQEGLILKPQKHKYSFKRSADWVKLKEIKSVDLQCVEYEEGEGKYEGMVGALVCQGIVEGKNVTVRVGSGLTDEDRNQHPSDYLGHVIEIKYNSVIQDSKTGQWSLFLPRFVEVRHDK